MTPAIEIRNLTCRYSKGTKSEVAAIKNISLSVGKGSFLGIIGHTGSGKSTLISHFNGLIKPDEGVVLVDGKDIWESKQSLRESRFKVGLCFQYPEYQLFEETVFKDIAFGPKNMKLPADEIKKRVLRSAAYAGLKPELLEKSPFDLSGGEKRRAAIAGIMAMEPEIIVFDEPAAGLDPAGRKELINMIVNYRKATGCTVIMVSHSMDDIAVLADKVCVLRNGEVAMYGTVDEVYSRADELHEAGLDVPEITRIFLNLSQRGLPVPTDVYTVEKGVSVLRNLLEKEGVK